MSMIFHCTKLCLYTCSSSLVIFIDQNANFKFQPPTKLVFLVFARVRSLQAVHLLMIYRHTKLHNPMLTGERFAYTLEVSTFSNLEQFKVQV
jgi:hypothetical protein